MDVCGNLARPTVAALLWYLIGGGVQAAFGFGNAAPAPGAFVIATGDRAGAGLAADAGIAAIVQGIIWDSFFNDPIPDVFFGPGGQGANFYEAEFFIPFDDGCVCAGQALVAADTGRPGVEMRSNAMEYVNFAIVAAAVGIG